jgi:hypothetical protein
MKNFRSLAAALSIAVVLGLAAAAIPAAAQTGPTLQTFQVERVLALNNILTTITPMADPAVLAGIVGGALEIRERIFYNPVQKLLTSTIFLVPTGSPLPTPLFVDLNRATIAVFTLSVDNVYVTSKPNAVMFVGVIGQSTATPYGNYQGAPAVVSVGYTNDSPAKITNVVDLIAGAVVTWSGTGAGTVTVVQPTTGGGGGGGGATGPTVVITPATQTAVTRQIRLDASQSTDSKGLALTYQWVALGPPTANIINPTSATPDVQFDNGFGLYTFQVTVTNSAGMSSMGTTTVQYLGH